MSVCEVHSGCRVRVWWASVCVMTVDGQTVRSPLDPNMILICVSDRARAGSTRRSNRVCAAIMARRVWHDPAYSNGRHGHDLRGQKVQPPMATLLSPLSRSPLLVPFYRSSFSFAFAARAPVLSRSKIPSRLRPLLSQSLLSICHAAAASPESR